MITPDDRAALLAVLDTLRQNIETGRPVSLVVSWIDWDAPDIHGYSFGHPVMCDAIAMNILRARAQLTQLTSTRQ